MDPGRLAPPKHILLIMVDGLGMPPAPLAESVYADCPALIRLMTQHAVRVDAGLDVPGTPQSATGQTAILTGVNAAREVGGHLSGFPNKALRDIIERENLFGKLLDAGRTCVFANAYARVPEIRLPLGLRSVTTVATLAALGCTLDRDDLIAGRAVYHDLTREWLREHGLPDIPAITESEAATHLTRICRTVDFCLFEYFLTDHAGHRGTREQQYTVLASLDRFLGELLATLDPASELLLLTSDHGNIEQPAIRGHSTNPVPFIAYGCAADAARACVTSLTDVTPCIRNLFPTP